MTDSRIMTIYPVYQLFACAALFMLALTYVNKRSKLPLPPGPRSLPIVGNLFVMPRVRPWLAYSRWAQQYGSDILHLRLPFQSVIILDSLTAARDLLDKRSNIYSDKPLTVMDEIVGWDWNMALMPYGRRWRNIRRVFHQEFNAGAVSQYHEVQAREIAAYLRRELHSDKATIHSINHLFSAIILDIVYGIQIKNMDDPIISIFMEAMQSFNEINVPGTFWVDSFPLFRHIPSWVPGTTFHQYGKIHRPKVSAMRENTFNAAREDIARGISKPSMVHKLVKQLQELYGNSGAYAEHEAYAKDAASVAYGAGVETSQSTTSWFILAMAMYPQVQENARSELNRVTGLGRLPTHEDLVSLPYLQAVFLEVARWQPAVPMGIPHRSMADDEYKGYHIPSGSIVVYNIWGMCHNEVDYPNPDVFDPERFLKDGGLNAEVRDPTTIIFGFGRRNCAGRHFARDALLLTFASVLSVFTIDPALDDGGKPLKLTTDAPGGVLLRPERLDCVLRPCSDRAAQLVKQSGL